MSERLSVTIAEIDEQRIKGWPDFHPEDFCHRCGGKNVRSWFVDSDRFNAAMGHPDGHQWNGIVCPGCFVELHEQATGMQTTWTLTPAEPFCWPTLRCPDCGDNGDCGETGFECGHEFHGNGEH